MSSIAVSARRCISNQHHSPPLHRDALPSVSGMCTHDAGLRFRRVRSNSTAGDHHLRVANSLASWIPSKSFPCHDTCHVGRDTCSGKVAIREIDAYGVLADSQNQSFSDLKAKLKSPTSEPYLANRRAGRYTTHVASAKVLALTTLSSRKY